LARAIRPAYARIMLRHLPVILFCVGLSGCILPPSSSQLLAESADDLSNAARMGRMDVAIEHVKDTSRDDYTRKHASWGRMLRIVDYEFSGLQKRKDGDADVFITVSWQRMNESTMRMTELAQRWTDKRGTWYLASEDERGGDPGLLAELTQKKDDGTPAEAPPAPPSRYQTKVIYEQ
jgi:hypothetical protein